MDYYKVLMIALSFLVTKLKNKKINLFWKSSNELFDKYIDNIVRD